MRKDRIVHASVKSRDVTRHAFAYGKKEIRRLRVGRRKSTGGVEIVEKLTPTGETF
jgi:hypothetical protein